MAVAGVAGVGHQHLVALVDQRQAGQLQRGRGAGRDDDAPGRHIHAKAAGVPGTDALAQLGQARCLGVLGATVADGALGSLLHQGRGAEVGFANVQIDHGRVAGAGLAGHLLCVLGHFHDIERLDALGAAG